MIEDNFLNETDFQQLQNFILSADFPLYYNKGIVEHPILSTNNVIDDFQFCHTFYRNQTWNGTYNLILDPILKKVNPFSISRIKVNVLPKNSVIIENTFHCDISPILLNAEQVAQWSTSIMYINTNNGYTMFEDGTKVESVENRFITFPANWKHKGTTCTDENIRVIINFNWFLNE